MNPRLPSSKKWTAFPKEYQTQIESVFREAFGARIGKAKVIVEGRIYTEEILLRVGYLEAGRLKQANFEVSSSYNPKKADALERIHDCVDAAASMMDEYLASDGEVEFPLSWSEYEFKKQKLFLQFSTLNSDLEAQADALLGSSVDDTLVDDSAESTEDALDLAETTNEPSILGGKKKNIH